METPTIDDLLDAIAQIPQMRESMNRIETLLTQRQPKPAAPADKWFDLPALCEYHPDKPARQTVYEWVSKGLIPCHKSGKKLRFNKAEIDTWLATDRRKTVAELMAEPALKNKGGKR